MSSFNVGDEVVVTEDLVDCTQGKAYTVDRITGHGVEIIDDAGDVHFIMCSDVSLYTGSQTAVPSPHIPDHTAAVLGTDDSGEDDYDTRKANARVTSAGRFEVGQSVVYSDGTPTPDGLTVVRCTATCVWFEETYSMPFNPDEFIRIEDDY